MYKELVIKELAKMLAEYGEVEPVVGSIITFKKDNIETYISVDYDFTISNYNDRYQYHLASRGKISEAFVENYPMGQSYKTINLLLEAVLKHYK